MTKADLVEKIAAKANLTKAAAERALNAFLASVEDALVKDAKLTLTGFGTFAVETRKARQGRNPRTGDTLTIPACKILKFRPGKMLKDSLNLSRAVGSSAVVFHSGQPGLCRVSCASHGAAARLRCCHQSRVLPPAPAADDFL